HGHPRRTRRAGARPGGGRAGAARPVRRARALRARPMVGGARAPARAPARVRSGDNSRFPRAISQAIIGRVPFVTGLVLAAGGSTRLGAPKQLLPYKGCTLLDHVLDTARACEFDQLVCVIGGSADDIRAGVDLSSTTVVENRHFGEGCSSSIAAALNTVDPRADVLVLMLGDQPGVT